MQAVTKGRGFELALFDVTKLWILYFVTSQK